MAPVGTCNAGATLVPLLAQVREIFSGNIAIDGVSKSIRTDRLQRELQIVQPSATKCSFIATL